MIWAYVGNDKVVATHGAKGKCTSCGDDVFARCGDIYVDHWSHYKDAECDTWYEPETTWHLLWKKTFGKENSEISIKKDGKLHRADVLTDENVVIELQNSPIKLAVIKDREEFYGERMLWVINGIHFKENFKITERLMFYRKRKLAMHTPRTIPGKLKDFDWLYARKSWSVAQRNVFIDFGNRFLFWVKSGLGNRFGEGVKILKKDFIKKYGGDWEFYKENRHIIDESIK